MRYQRGSIQEKSGAFYVVYRNTERKQVWHKLCDKDRNTGHGTPSSPSVRLLADEHMRTVNIAKQDAATVVAFWDDVYWPHVQENYKPATAVGYRQIFNQHLRGHFGARTLTEYRTHHGSIFLTGLAKTLRPRTIKNVKNLASGLFTHAINLGKIETNPFRDCKVLGRHKLKNGETGVYSLEEIENIISALVEYPMAQLIMSLSFFLGLRRGEIAGLQWGDVSENFLHVRRAISLGQVSTPKTEKSVRDLPLIVPVKVLLVLWRPKCPATKDGWMFPNENGRPMKLAYYAKRTIKPVLKKAETEWKGYHAGRRGLGITLRALTGNSIAGQNMLGHTDEKVTQGHYEAALPEVVMAGMRMLEAATVNKKR